jgi:hypothetical protein
MSKKSDGGRGAVDVQALAITLAGIARVMAERWKSVPKLIESGKLEADSRGWYRVNDPAAVMKQVGRIVEEIEFDRSGRPTRLRFVKLSLAECEELAKGAPERQ